MTYLTLEELKKQCNIEEIFNEDNAYLESLGDAAEDFVQAHLNCPLDDICAENSGELPRSLHQAMLLMVDYLYDVRGSGDSPEIPQAFWVLTNPWKTYSIA